MSIKFFSLSRFLLLLIFITCCRSQSNNSLCPPSSCGNIKDIHSPFRLKGDPTNCGYPDFELDCQNNQTVISFNSMKFFVQSINYNNLTIRVVDPGLINTSNCSFPLNPYATNLYGDISRQDLLWYYISTKKIKFLLNENNLPIVFISCVDPISYSSHYIDISICRGRNTTGFWNPSRTYRYTGVVNNTPISELPETCGVEKVAFASANGPLAEKNASLVDIYNGLAYGFELSWYRVLSGKWKATHRFCSLEGNNNTVLTCYHCTPNELGGYGLPCHLLDFILTLAAKAVTAIVGLLVLRFFIGIVCLMVLVVHKWRRWHLSGDETIEDFLQVQTNLLPIKYSYSDIKKMTNKFKHKLGEGGYGIVYKGKLRSGHLVAVKITNKSISSEREFSNELGTIGRVHHVNVVQLIGFCTEGSKHALVYEYMPNGSLDKYISPTAGLVALTYKNMFDISLRVARGIDYLHKGCDMQILHFDIKPHNILLDEDFKPKVSDFGLAKLYPTHVNTVTLPTTARGTTGYMAPELFYKNIGGVSYKADVYSFGMLLMDLASRKENINPFAEDVGQIYFPSWVYDQLNAGKEIDMGNVSDEERMMVKKMIKIALWCIQIKPGSRPSMNKVVEMLEGDAELVHMPPRPFIAHFAIADPETRISATTET